MSSTPGGRIERGETKEQVVGSQKCAGLEQSDLCTECVGWWRQECAEGLASSFSPGFSRTQAVCFSHILNLAKAKRHSLNTVLEPRACDRELALLILQHHQHKHTPLP